MFYLTINDKGQRSWYPSRRKFRTKHAAVSAAKRMTPVQGPRGEDLGVRVDVWECPSGKTVAACKRVWRED